MSDEKEQRSKPSKLIDVRINPDLPERQNFTVGRGKYGGQAGDIVAMPEDVFEQFKDWEITGLVVLAKVPASKGKGSKPDASKDEASAE